MKCKIEGCEKTAYVKGMCDMHRKRLARHGHIEQTRPTDWGQREKHPLYSSWCWIKASEFSVCLAWLDFWVFVQDVGERPSEKHKIQRIMQDKPYAKDNYIWKLPDIPMESNSKEGKAAWQRAYRQFKPNSFRQYEYKRRMQFSEELFQELFKKQNGVCAICSKPETRKIRNKVIRLSVDHCHTTGVIRGLLCTNCNTGIGLLQDNEQLMLNAIEYLRKGTKK